MIARAKAARDRRRGIRILMGVIPKETQSGRGVLRRWEWGKAKGRSSTGPRPGMSPGDQIMKLIMKLT